AGQLPVTGDEQCRGTAHVRCRHARPVHALHLFLAPHRRLDLLPRSHEVGLCPPVAGGPATREIADTVGLRLEPVRGAPGDDAGGVARVGDTDAAVAVLRTARGEVLQVPVVPRRGHHHDAATHQALALLAHRGAPAGEVGDV